MKINWNYPTSMWVGDNRVQDVSKACKQLGISNPLFVTDKDLINLDMTNKLLINLKKEFNHFVVFSNFSGNPFGENVEDGVKNYNQSQCDGVKISKSAI